MDARLQAPPPGKNRGGGSGHKSSKTVWPFELNNPSHSARKKVQNRTQQRETALHKKTKGTVAGEKSRKKSSVANVAPSPGHGSRGGVG